MYKPSKEEFRKHFQAYNKAKKRVDDSYRDVSLGGEARGSLADAIEDMALCFRTLTDAPYTYRRSHFEKNNRREAERRLSERDADDFDEGATK